MTTESLPAWIEAILNEPYRDEHGQLMYDVPTEAEAGYVEAMRDQEADFLRTFKDEGEYRAYERRMIEMHEEYEAQRAAGGRSICPRCGERSVLSSDVLTYGVRGNPNSEYSVMSECERASCDYREM